MDGRANRPCPTSELCIIDCLAASCPGSDTANTTISTIPPYRIGVSSTRTTSYSSTILLSPFRVLQVQVEVLVPTAITRVLLRTICNRLRVASSAHYELA
jgi:hypothetical protein